MEHPLGASVGNGDDETRREMVWERPDDGIFGHRCAFRFARFGVELLLLCAPCRESNLFFVGSLSPRCTRTERRFVLRRRARVCKIRRFPFAKRQDLSRFVRQKQVRVFALRRARLRFVRFGFAPVEFSCGNCTTRRALCPFVRGRCAFGAVF